MPWRWASGEGEDSDATTKQALHDLSARLAILERQVYTNAEWNQETWDADELNLRKLAGILVATAAGRGGVATDAGGRIDVWAPVRRKLVKAEQILPIYASRRFGIAPTAAQLERGDDAWLPFTRYKGEPPDGDTPILWDRWPTKRGRIVAFATGSTKLLPEAAFQALMKKHSQDGD